MIGSLARFVARTFFREIVLEGTERLPKQGPAIFTPNHPNGLIDPLLLFFLPRSLRLRFVAKAPLFKVPVFGSILRAIGAIPVVRKFEASGNVDYGAFFAACVDALANGDCIIIFPEGRSLPQAYLAPLKTGPVRLAFLAKKKEISAPIIPIGLNYEKGTTFRSRVLVRIGAPLIPQWNITDNESAAVRNWTEALSEQLEQNVIQAESYRDRELMLLLERISAGQENADFPGFTRLKQFEKGLSLLQSSAAGEIDTLRKLLSRYERLSRAYGLRQRSPQPFSKKFVAGLLGAILAIPGWVINVVPYHLCDWLIRTTKRDAADTATFKVVYSLFLFPAFYAVEAYAMHRYFGTAATVFFLLGVLPLSYFTLFWLEYYDAHMRGLFWTSSRKRMKSQLQRLRARIVERLEKLANTL